MSSMLTTLSYVRDSEEDYWSMDMVTTLAAVIQNIQDGYYSNSSKIYLDTLHFIETGRAGLGVVIKGISLGSGTKEIYQKGDLVECINGIRGKIAIIYEYYGTKGSVGLDEIHCITRGDTIERASLIESIIPPILTLENNQDKISEGSTGVIVESIHALC